MARSAPARSGKRSRRTSADSKAIADALEDQRRGMSTLALNAADEVSALKDVHRACACLESLLVPVQLSHSDEFYITPRDLRALMSVVNAELQRRIEAVDTAIESLTHHCAPS